MFIQVEVVSMFSKSSSEGLPECGEKMPVEQSPRALLICRVLQQLQIFSIESMEAVEYQNGNVSSLYLGNKGHQIAQTKQSEIPDNFAGIETNIHKCFHVKQAVVILQFMKIKIFICKLWASRHAEPRNI
jgi:hypothetical protein